MQPVSPFIPHDVFTKFLLPTNLQTIVRCERVCKAWAETIRSNNQLWQILIRKGFNIAPGKYICFCMPRDEYKFLFQFMKKVLADGGTQVGQFHNPENNNSHSFPRLRVDAQERVFFSGSRCVRNAKNKIVPYALGSVIPGKFVNSKNNYVLVSTTDGNYQFLDVDLALFATITSDVNITTFEVLEQGFLTGNEEGTIQLWSFNGDFIKNILQLDGPVFDLFTVQLCDEKSAILAWHVTREESSSQKTDTNLPQVVSLFGLDDKKLEQTNLSKINNEFICMVKKIDEERFAVVIGEHTAKNAFIVSSTEDMLPLLLNAEVKDMVVDNGKVYMLVDDRPTEGDECSIHVWGADGHYFGRTIRQADRIDVYNDKIFFRCADSYAVGVHDLSFLPKDDKAWYQDLNNFKLFPDQDKNQVFGIFYCLIKPTLRDGEDYFGCAEHAFEGIHCFGGRFDDSLRKEAIYAHLLLNKLNTAIATGNTSRATKCFDRLPHALKRSLEWGVWIFEGMPMGNTNFGSDFLHAHPTHSSVKQSLQYFRENGLPILSYELRQELRKVKETLNSPALTQETAVECLALMSPPARGILQKCAEVLENAPHSSEGYNGSADSLTRAINNLVDKL